MARRIIWSFRAQADRKSIFEYWNDRNKSNRYSNNLNVLLISAVEFVSRHPHTGRKTDRNQIRIKFVGNYAIVYEAKSEVLEVLAIFDTRQNPDNLKKILDS